MSETLSLGRARSVWWERQGLGDEEEREDGIDVARAIGVTGWLRTLGGTDVYIAARARAPGMKRADLDAAVARGDLRVVPAVRGCIYLVPARVVGDLMALNAPVWRKQTEKELAKVGASFSVIESTAVAVLDVLAQPLTPDAIRKALPAGSIPSFGDAGKKVGLSSPLPLALRYLEFDGRIERTLDGGRLDSERYLWRRSQYATQPAAPDEATRLANVITAFLDFAGPSTLEHIATWSGRAQRDLKPILETIRAEPVHIEGLGDAFAQRGDIDCAHEAPLPVGIRLLAFEDNYLTNHGGPNVVTDPKHHHIKADIWGDSENPEPLGTANHILSRTIVVDGLVAGFWEVDPRAHGAVWHTFEPQKPAVAEQIDALANELAHFLLDDVGNARVFSLDTMELVQQRADRIAKLSSKSKSKSKSTTKSKSKSKPKKVAAKRVVKPKASKPKSKPKPKPKSKPKKTKN